jgi:hypothetical protein
MTAGHTEEQMALILFNPTNEKMQTQYIGEDIVLDPGAKVRVDDARGRHVLNVLGPRGLVTLEYGDEGEGEQKKAIQGRERNLTFKKKQIADFNVMNDQRFQSKQPYITPADHIKAYSRELGIKVFEPYSTSDAAMTESADLRAELDKKARELTEKDLSLSTLQAQVAELTQMMSKFMGANASAGGAVGIEHWEAFRLKFRSINGKHFHKWVADQWSEITQAPAEVMQELSDKYTRLYALPFPANEVEARTVAQQVAA